MEVWATYEVCSKLARKTPKQPAYCYLWTNFTLVLDDWNDGTGAIYLCKFFWLKAYSQYLLRCLYYVLFTKILQGGDTPSETFLHKRCCRTCG